MAPSFASGSSHLGPVVRDRPNLTLGLSYISICHPTRGRAGCFLLFLRQPAPLCLLHSHQSIGI